MNNRSIHPTQQQKSSRKSRLVAGVTGFALTCSFLAGPPGCKSPGHLPHPPGLSLAGASATELQNGL